MGALLDSAPQIRVLVLDQACWETFPAAVVAAGHNRLAHHTLEDFERLYVGVGPVNYGWYQCQLQRMPLIASSAKERNATSAFR